MAASKFLFENEDDIVTNQIWSEALNMDVKELNILEQKFLAAIVSAFLCKFTVCYFFNKIINLYAQYMKVILLMYNFS